MHLFQPKGRKIYVFRISLITTKHSINVLSNIVSWSLTDVFMPYIGGENLDPNFRQPFP